MRILLVQHALENNEAYPLGLGYVAAALTAAGHPVDFLDLSLVPGNGAEILLKRAEAGRARVIGFTAVTPQYPACLSLVKKIRPRLNGTRIILGGPHPSALPEEVLRDGAADIVVISEGEAVAPKLVAALEKEADLGSIPGIAFLDERGDFVQTAPGTRVRDLDTIPYPPWDILQPGRYQGRIRGRRRANLMTTRGCPYHCVHCYRGPAGGNHYRRRSIENILGEIRTLHNDHGIGGFGFRDDMFSLDMDRTREFCDILSGEKYRIFWNCQTRIDRVDRDLLRRMKRAGCICVEFGVESGSDHILKKLRKKTNKEMIRQAFGYCHEIGMPCMAFFMVGTPWETLETVNESIRFARELRGTITLFFQATPFPGTELREAFLEAGLRVPEDYSEYRHFIEGKDFDPGAGNDASSAHRRFFAAQCRRATRQIVLAQLKDIRHYPELLRAHLRRNSVKGFSVEVARRIRGIMRLQRS